MTILASIGDVVDNFFLKKNNRETANVDCTSYYIQYGEAYNMLGSIDGQGVEHDIIMWQFAPDCMLFISAYPNVYDISSRLLTGRLELMNRIIYTAHKRFNTELITLCEPHHFHIPNFPNQYDLCNKNHVPVVLKVIPVITVQQPVTYEQMAVLL